ncbi:MAG: hypothetical protein EXS31_00365 [Pedosphaera sp.]|nr:hypothetical protein [Pedosphaera sp.]
MLRNGPEYTLSLSVQSAKSEVNSLKRRSGAVVSVIFLVLLMVLTHGCASRQRGNVSRPSGGGGGGIGALHLFGAPLALDFDDKPGSDGFAVTIYASNGTQARGLQIRTGTMEVLMFDGTPHAQGSTAPEPSRTWTFTAKQLDAYAHKYAIGIGYRLTLSWAETLPTRDRITVLARYTSPKGETISSGPSTIAVLAR